MNAVNAARLMWAGLAVAGVSVMAAAERDRLAEHAATVRPAKVTLRKTEVREWTLGYGNWNAFGTFDVVAGDHRGVAEGDLAPRAHRWTGRRTDSRKTPRERAETFVADWQVGRTYDAYWAPAYPHRVSWDPVPVQAQARFTVALRAGAVLLFAIGLWSRIRPAS
jgi:hypothetical protein